MTSMLMLIVCLVVAVIVTVVVIGGMYFLMIAADGDTVSAAREGWIHRRSEKDTEED